MRQWKIEKKKDQKKKISFEVKEIYFRDVKAKNLYTPKKLLDGKKDCK
jgi:hypothetical protein